MSESLTHSLRDTRNIVFLRNVGCKEFSSSAALLNRVAHQFQAFPVARYQRDIRACFGEGLCHRLAKTAAPASDDSGSASQINVHVCISLMPEASRNVSQAAEAPAILLRQAPRIQTITRSEHNILFPVDQIANHAARFVGVQFAVPKHLTFVGAIDD